MKVMDSSGGTLVKKNEDTIFEGVCNRSDMVKRLALVGENKNIEIYWMECAPSQHVPTKILGRSPLVCINYQHPSIQEISKSKSPRNNYCCTVNQPWKAPYYPYQDFILVITNTFLYQRFYRKSMPHFSHLQNLRFQYPKVVIRPEFYSYESTRGLPN